jgi:hypothetical protein
MAEEESRIIVNIVLLVLTTVRKWTKSKETLVICFGGEGRWRKSKTNAIFSYVPVRRKVVQVNDTRISLFFLISYLMYFKACSVWRSSCIRHKHTCWHKRFSNGELRDLYSRLITWRRLTQAGHAASMVGKRKTSEFWSENQKVREHTEELDA